MSHFTAIDIEIRDLGALADACAELGLPLLQHAEARGYGSQRLQADHVIRLKGPYDIALVRREDGAYTFSADLWRGHVEEETGKDFGRLKQLYGVHRATREARTKGLAVRRRQLTDGTVRLSLSRA